MYSADFIERVRKATDIVELVREYAPDLKYLPDNNTAMCRCPHPDHKDNNPSFSVKRKEQTWCCYSCHNGPDENGRYQVNCFAFLQWVSKGEISFPKSVKILAEKAGIPLPNDKNQETYTYNYKKSLYYKKQLTDEALNYLYYRGLNNNDIEEWQIGYDPLEKRIMFPMFNKNKSILDFAKRVLTRETKGVNRKYLFPTGFKTSKYLYGLHNINKKYEYIIITEGIMDVILAHKYNVKNVVCVLGSTLHEFHVEQIKDLNLTPILIYDNDSSGVKSYKKAMELLINNDIYPKICLLPPGMDLADICSQCKAASRQYIEQNTYTYGYLKLKDIFDSYNKDMYNLRLKYKPLIEKELTKVPNYEKDVMKDFIESSLKINL